VNAGDVQAVPEPPAAAAGESGRGDKDHLIQTRSGREGHPAQADVARAHSPPSRIWCRRHADGHRLLVGHAFRTQQAALAFDSQVRLRASLQSSCMAPDIQAVAGQAQASKRHALEQAVPKRARSKRPHDALQCAPPAAGTAPSFCLTAVSDGAEYQALLDEFPGTRFEQLVGLRSEHGSLSSVREVLLGRRPGMTAPRRLRPLAPGFAALFIGMTHRPEPS